MIAAVLVSMPSPALAKPVDWSGQWDTSWRGGGARVSLTQEGDRVTGVYSLYDGRVEGSVDGRELRGQWWQGDNTGSFFAVQSTDGLSFTATLGNGEWWTGVRAINDEQALGFAVDQSSPASTLYFFLMIMNSVGHGTMELKSEAAQLINWSALPDAQVSPLDYTELLDETLSQLTFRTRDLQQTSGGDTYEVVLRQAGTDLPFDLRFSKIDDHWYIDPKPSAQLQAELDVLATARLKPEDPKLAKFASPRASLKTLMTEFDEGNRESINQVITGLDLSNMSELSKRYESKRLAGYIKRAMARVGTPVWQEIPDNPQRLEPYTVFEHPEGSIVLAPSQTEQGTVWQFTPETLRDIRALYATIDDLPQTAQAVGTVEAGSLYFVIRDWFGRLPDIWTDMVGPMELWQWVGVALALILSYGLGRVVSVLIGMPLLRLFKTNLDEHPFYQTSLVWSLRLLVMGVTLRLIDEPLGLPDWVEVSMLTTSFTFIVLSITVMLLMIVNLVTDRITRVQSLAGHNITLVSLLAGILRVAIVVIGILILADLLGVPYQGVLAGLGVGGLAVALAAQSTLQNFISGITLYFDKPIAIGDYCRFGSREGTVEFIGMRSTRIRTLDRTLVTVPNSEFSNLQIENYAKRDRTFLNTTIEVRYETTPDQMRFLLAEIRKLLIAHPLVAPDPLRVRFDGFGDHSLNISIFAYVLTNDRSEFLAIKEDLFLRMMELVHEAGAQFAVPSMVYYEAQDTPHDPAKVKAAESAVDQWRQDSNLPFPDFAWQDKAEISGTLDYPPTGSALSQKLDAQTIVSSGKDEKAPAPDFPEPNSPQK